MQKIPKRRFKLDIDGKIFEASELSARYLMDAVQNPDSDTVEAALNDAMQLTDEDYKLFGQHTAEQVYYEIVKFTFKEELTAKDIERIISGTGLSEKEVATLSTDAKIQLKGIFDRRGKKGSEGKR